jgi:hypothetical protein
LFTSRGEILEFPVRLHEAREDVGGLTPFSFNRPRTGQTVKTCAVLARLTFSLEARLPLDNTVFPLFPEQPIAVVDGQQVESRTGAVALVSRWVLTEL